VDIYVPGCPPRPDAIIEGIARAAALLGQTERRPLTDEDVKDFEPCAGCEAANVEGEASCK
jgi:NADH:ubiquinone oxidoreductase subunit B-like Fe-S oxidoreductase